ncbi:hypothetical protein [Trebonia kvetii]|uniref:hypothetical protein n=1 Tax=Trebonia kvetii TaxID=2480626 RepID=UPI001651BF91|nr:hypothetical protein [Trebonia kvetii]
MARVAALRSATPPEPVTGPQVPQQSGLAEGEGEKIPEEGGTTVPEEDRDV